MGISKRYRKMVTEIEVTVREGNTHVFVLVSPMFAIDHKKKKTSESAYFPVDGRSKIEGRRKARDGGAKGAPEEVESRT